MNDFRRFFATMVPVSIILFMAALMMANHKTKNDDTIETFSLVAGHMETEVQDEETKEGTGEPQDSAFIPTLHTVLQLTTMGELQKYLYNIDKSALITREELDIQGFLQKNFQTELRSREPKILIFHTHSQETFRDSRPGETEDTIVGVGKRLAEILAEEYKIPVIHDVGVYDRKNGRPDRAGSYQTMESAVKRILAKYPSIEIVIDIHRDGVPEDIHFVTEVDGRQTAKIMFFNGLTQTEPHGSKASNPYLADNLALSLQLQLAANEMYPDLARRIYLKQGRYSLFMKPKSILVEIGADTNTVEEAKNAVIPLAKVITQVLDGNE